MKATLWKELDDSCAENTSGGKATITNTQIFFPDYYVPELNGQTGFQVGDMVLNLAAYSGLKVPGNLLKNPNSSSIVISESLSDYGQRLYTVTFNTTVNPNGKQTLV
jgi:hypothetical protein